MARSIAVLFLLCLSFLQLGMQESNVTSTSSSGRNEITHLSFLCWKAYTPLVNQRVLGQKAEGNEALVMGDSKEDQFLLLPEWEKGREKVEPAAFTRGTSPKIHARFTVENTQERRLLKAKIYAESGTDGFPGVGEKTVEFDDNGVSIGKKYDNPKVDLVAMDLKGKFPDEVMVEPKYKLAWKAKDREYNAEPKFEKDPIDLGTTEVEIYLIDKNTVDVEKSILKEEMRFFFKNLVKFSCQNFKKEAKSPREQLDNYMDNLHKIEYKYIFPFLGKPGTASAMNMLPIERAVDQIIDSERGNCGRWVYLWLQVTNV